MGVDAMPAHIKNSMILTGNDLGMLANVEALPTEEEVAAINDANDKLKKLLENEDLSIDDLKNGIDELAKASQSFAEKLYAEAQNDTANPSSDESDDVVEGEVIEDG